jgi:hypothetical protein
MESSVMRNRKTLHGPTVIVLLFICSTVVLISKDTLDMNIDSSAVQSELIPSEISTINNYMETIEGRDDNQSWLWNNSGAIIASMVGAFLAGLVALLSINRTHKKNQKLQLEKDVKDRGHQEDIYCGILFAIHQEISWHKNLHSRLTEELPLIHQVTIEKKYFPVDRVTEYFRVEFLQESRISLMQFDRFDTDFMSLLSAYINLARSINENMNFERANFLKGSFENPERFTEGVDAFFSSLHELIDKAESGINNLQAGVKEIISSFPGNQLNFEGEPDETWIHFNYGDIIGDKQELSSWISTLGMIANDLNLTNTQLLNYNQDDFRRHSPEVSYYFWLTCSHYRETAKFLGDTLDLPVIQAFIASLDEGIKEILTEVRQRFEPWEGSFVQEIAKGIRDTFIHYPLPRDEVWNNLWNELREKQGEIRQRDTSLAGTRWVFADDIRVNITQLELDLNDTHMAENIGNLGNAVANVIMFCQTTITEHLDRLPDGQIYKGKAPDSPKE